MGTPLVIVGSGMAGYGLLRAVRHADRKRRVWVYTADDGCAYTKSQLACGLARGKMPSDLVLATAEQMAHRLDATIVTHTQVRAIDRARQRLITERGEQAYSHLVLALGACPVRPTPLRGSAAGQVLTLASLADYRYFRSELDGRRRVAVLGGGLLGCEFAEGLVRAGCEATLFEAGNRLVGDKLPGLCAARVARTLQAAGVRVRLEDGVQSVDQGQDELELTTLNGQRLSADLVVVALGVRPHTALARDAGLAVGRGILVDHQLRTADPAIFALGECAELSGRLFALGEDIEVAARVLAAVLGGTGSRMSWQPRLQRVQLECCPAVLCEPPPIAGEWHESATNKGVRALFHDRRGALRGFTLVGEPVSDAARLFGLLRR